MGIPQVTDRIKEAPAHVLRAVFSGFGQLLLAAERLRGQPGGPTPAPAQGRAPGEGQARSGSRATGDGQAPAGGPDPAAPRRRSLDQTGNVRILSADDPAEDAPLTPPAPAQADSDQAVPDQAVPDQADSDQADSDQPGATQPVPDQPSATQAAPGQASRAQPEPTGDPLPVPGYDALSLPSLRARLRNLDTSQLRVLIAYERAHAGRADVVTMFERRIAKLTGE
jgi:hypothetical protein